MKGRESNSGAKQTHKMLSVKKCSVKGFKESNGRPMNPPRPLTPFFLFTNEFREKFLEKEKQKPTALSEIFRAAKAEWETLSDADKAPYVEEYKKDWEEYEERLEVFKKALYAWGAKKRKEAKSMAVAEELSANLTGLIIRQ